MPACGSKFVCRSSKMATVAESVFLGSPRSRGRMPSLVGDIGRVLGVLGWALTRIRNLPLVLQCCIDKIFQQWVCVEQSCELFTDIRGKGGASNVC